MTFNRYRLLSAFVVVTTMIFPVIVLARPLKVCHSEKSGSIVVRKKCRTKRGQVALDISSLQGLSGQSLTGPSGPPGPAGPTGATGPRGPAGPRGAGGVSAHSFSESEAGYPAFSLHGGSVKEVLSLQRDFAKRIEGDGELLLQGPGTLYVSGLVTLKNTSLVEDQAVHCSLHWRGERNSGTLSDLPLAPTVGKGSRTRLPLFGRSQISKEIINDEVAAQGQAKVNIVLECTGTPVVLAEGGQISAQFLGE